MKMCSDMTHSEGREALKKAHDKAADKGRKKKVPTGEDEKDYVTLSALAPRLSKLVPDSLRAFLLRNLGTVAVLAPSRAAKLAKKKQKTSGEPEKLLKNGKAGDAASPEREASSILMATFHESLPGALEAYKLFNSAYPVAEKELNAEMIAQAVKFGYLGWPRRIQKYVQHKDVLDVGCGTGIHSIGYVVVGVKSYTGMDPVMKLDSDRAKNIRKRAWESFGWTPRQIMDQFKRVDLVPGTFEDFTSGRTFDVAVLHNVTEHLIGIEEVLRSTATRLRSDGVVLFNHHNFYCWNGHHQQPKTIDKINPNEPEQKKYVDWAHIRFEAPADHYFHRGLNKIRLDDLKALVERYYDIEVWEEIPSNERNGGKRLTNEIVARFPELSRRELAVHNVFCIAKRKREIASSRRDILRDADFLRFYETCKPFTMTSMERLYSVYISIKHIVDAGIDGDVVECGTWRGGSMMMAALALRHFGDDGKRRLYLYDTFAGMPEPTEFDKKFEGLDAQAKWSGTSADDGGSTWNLSTLEETKANMVKTGFDLGRIVFVEGRVEDTIPGAVPDKISLLRLDTDFYPSTRHEFEHLYPRLQPGGILIVDDYGTWEGAYKATEEYFSRSQSRPFLSRIDVGGRVGIKP